MNNRDDFSQSVKQQIQKRAAFICSNPECRCSTIAPSDTNATAVLYIGNVAHITSAAEGGPRYNPDLSSEERSSIDNAIFLCASCATLIDKNNGEDFSTTESKEWKNTHEEWVRSNLNKNSDPLTEIAGTHEAEGIGEVTALEINRPAKIKPGTISKARGKGKITGTKIN